MSLKAEPTRGFGQDSAEDDATMKGKGPEVSLQKGWGKLVDSLLGWKDKSHRKAWERWIRRRKNGNAVAVKRTGFMAP